MEFTENFSQIMAEYAGQCQGKADSSLYTDHTDCHDDSYNYAAQTY